MTLKQIDPAKLDGKFIDMIGNDWMLITSGTMDSFNMMTASWGFLGFMWGLPAATCFVRPSRYTKEWIDKTHSLTLSFFPDKYKKVLSELGSKSGRDMDKMKNSGLTPIALPTGDVTYKEATLTLVCRVMYRQQLVEKDFIDPTVMPKWYPNGSTDLHYMYITQIQAVFQRPSGLF